MTEPIPDYVAAARTCFSFAGFRQVLAKAEANGHLTEELGEQLTPIGEALSAAEQAEAGDR